MNFATYSDLVASISDMLNRTDLDSAIPGFIKLMESDANKRLRTRQQMVSTSFTIDSEFENRPAGLQEVRSFYLNTVPVKKLNVYTVDELVNEKARIVATGKPQGFTTVGDQFQFVPSPDVSYQATLVYYETIPALSDAATSNWLLAAHPDIYFYGSLIHSAPYLKDDARIQVWMGLYEAAMSNLMIADDRAKTASNGLKSTSRVF